MIKFLRTTLVVALLAIVFTGQHGQAFLRRNLFPETELVNRHLTFNDIHGSSSDSGALFLTPYIEAGKLAEGRKLSEAHNLPNTPQITSYSGFLTVNKTYNSNLFFWFFPALSGKTDVPVLLWLQGGPGGSSLFGLFVENGPLEVTSAGNVQIRNTSWNNEYAVLYIDNPVGTGYSFTDKDAGYARNENDVARDLYEGLKQFFTLYQDYQGKPFYVTGESYAGKYVPAIAHKIYKMGDDAKSHGINLKGLAIGDGLCDPRNMGNYGQFLYQVGLLDENQRDYFFAEQKKAIRYIDDGQFYKAFQIFDFLLNGDLINGTSYFQNVTGLNFYYNFLLDKSPAAFNYYVPYLGLKATRQAMHVGNRPYNDGSEVEKHLLNDIMNTVKPWVEDLLNANYRTLIYSGQLDIIVAAPLTENFLQKLNWKGANQYLTAPRKVYKLENHVAGYARRAGPLYQVIIRNAGHILPYDQPKVALDMITRFVNQQDF